MPGSTMRSPRPVNEYHWSGGDNSAVSNVGETSHDAPLISSQGQGKSGQSVTNWFTKTASNGAPLATSQFLGKTFVDFGD